MGSRPGKKIPTSYFYMVDAKSGLTETIYLSKQAHEGDSHAVADLGFSQIKA